MFDEKFWLAISFLTFLALMAKFIFPIISKALGNKAKLVEDEILEAKKMREEAQNLLNKSKEILEDAKNYSKNLIQDAKDQAEKLIAESEAELKKELDKKTAIAKERIKNEEEKAIREVKSGIIGAAIKLIEEQAAEVSKKSAAEINEDAISNISKMIN